MRTFYYFEYDGLVHNELSITDEEIIETYWPFWKSKMMEKYGSDNYLITQENCVADWIVVNWAFEKDTASS